eukprot:TRINITY_DN11002_c0_g1_i2.p1 TRINITY_DN11002_c0_g1~~TRINITY_DN11002_c0_g1_i2.p1  ORF type:complete len:239 (+),score=20.50 TRINITY_DN11002_c0_g1_i2:98-718(+)
MQVQQQQQQQQLQAVLLSPKQHPTFTQDQYIIDNGEKISRQEFIGLKLEVQQLTEPVGGVHNLVSNLLTPLHKLVEQQKQRKQVNNKEEGACNQAQVELLVEKLMPGIQDRLGDDLASAQNKLLQSVTQLISGMDQKYEALGKQIQSIKSQPQQSVVLEKIKQVQQTAESKHQFADYKLEQLRIDFGLRMQKLEIAAKIKSLKQKS